MPFTLTHEGRKARDLLFYDASRYVPFIQIDTFADANREVALIEAGSAARTLCGQAI
jgi:hypothetical protein